MIHPNPYDHVMITYLGSVRTDCYGGRKPAVVTEKGFYVDSDGYYNSKDEWIATPDGYYMIPHSWGTWYWSDGTSSLMPKGMYHTKVLPIKVHKWTATTI